MGSLLLGGGAALAVEVAGERLPPAIEVAGQPLELAACAPREILWQDVYALGLYLPRPDTSVAYINDPDTAKAVQVVVAYEGEVPDRMPDTWRERLREPLGPDLLADLERRYATLQTGDRITAHYAPDEGSTLLVNDEPVASQPDPSLMEALLSVWLGSDPVSDSMRRELLSGTC